MRLGLLAASLVGLASCAAVQPPPRSVAADRFYAKYVEAAGIPVTSSPRVPDKALLAARSMAEGMLAHRPDLAQVLVRARLSHCSDGAR